MVCLDYLFPGNLEIFLVLFGFVCYFGLALP